MIGKKIKIRKRACKIVYLIYTPICHSSQGFHFTNLRQFNQTEYWFFLSPWRFGWFLLWIFEHPCMHAAWLQMARQYFCQKLFALALMLELNKWRFSCSFLHPFLSKPSNQWLFSGILFTKIVNISWSFAFSRHICEICEIAKLCEKFSCLFVWFVVKSTFLFFLQSGLYFLRYVTIVISR